MANFSLNAIRCQHPSLDEKETSMSTDNAKKLRVPGLIVALAAASLALTGCFGGGGNADDSESTKGPQPESSSSNEGGSLGTPPETEEEEFKNPETQSVFDITVGTCIANQEDLGTGTEVMDVPIVPCTQPHAYEVFYEYNVADASTYPGETVISDEAEKQCTGPEFTNFIGHDWNNTALGVTWFYPTMQSWGTGDRVVSCMVYEEGADTGNPTTGSLAGSMK